MKPPPRFQYIGPEEDLRGPFYYMLGRDASTVTFWSDSRHNPHAHGNTWRGEYSEARKLFKRLPE